MEENYYKILKMYNEFEEMKSVIKQDITTLTKDATMALKNNVKAQTEAQNWINLEKRANCFPIIDGAIAYNPLESVNYTFQYFVGMNRNMGIVFFEGFADKPILDAEEVDFDEVLKHIDLNYIEILYRELRNFITRAEVGSPRFYM